jgi:hypothetical protein
MAPWLGISVRTNSLSVCANSSVYFQVNKAMRLSEALNIPELQTYRAEHAQSWPLSSCHVCTFRGQAQINTLKDYFDGLKVLLKNQETTPAISADNLVLLDLNLSNVCNLKCRMCSHLRSSSWKSDQKQLSENLEFVKAPETQIESPLELDFENFPNLRFIVLKGGEPFFDKKSIALLEKLVATGLSKKIFLTTFTNGVFVNKYHNLLKEFLHVTLMFSFEATGGLYSYIRGGSSTFAEFEENILNVAHLPSVHLGFMYTPQAYNVFDLPDSVDWLWNKLSPRLPRPLNEKKLRSYFGNTLQTPAYLSISALPRGLREAAVKKIESSNMAALSPWGSLKPIYLSEHAEQKSLYQQFLRYTKTLDKIRGESVLDHIPEFGQTDFRGDYENI